MKRRVEKDTKNDNEKRIRAQERGVNQCKLNSGDNTESREQIQGNGRGEGGDNKLRVRPWGVKREIGYDIREGRVKGLSPRWVNVREGKKMGSTGRAPNKTSNMKGIRGRYI